MNGTPLIDRVRRTARLHGLLAGRRRLLVGVSGGADSVCLLYVLRALQDEWDVALHVAHLNHQLRGGESERDSHFVSALAARWELPATIEAVDVHGRAAREGLGLEEAARRCRYEFFDRVAGRVGADGVVVAHHAGDQAETLIMRFLRGTGGAGLAGMQPLSACPYASEPRPLIRPLLFVARADILAYCDEHRLEYCQDSSNRDTRFLRNQVRHELLPQLEKLAPGLEGRLSQTADLLAADEAALAGCLEQQWPGLVYRATKEAVTLNRSRLRQLSVGLQRRAIRKAAGLLSPQGFPVDWSYRHVEQARALALDGQTGVRIDLPGGVSGRVQYDHFILSGQGAPVEYDYSGPLVDRRVELPIGRPLALPDSTWQVLVEQRPVDSALLAQARGNVDPWQAFLDADVCGPDIVLRPRQSGERFQPLGLQGHSRLLSDYMIDERIPAGIRGRLPLLCTAHHVAWVVGRRLDERVRLTEASETAYHARFWQREI